MTGFDAEGIRALCVRAGGRERESTEGVVVFADRALLTAPSTKALLAAVAWDSREPLVRPVSGPPELEAVLEDARALRGFSAVLAFGGGSVIDRAKLARAAAAGAELRSATESAPGHVRLDTAASPLPLIALPTTLGTGSERNTNAVLDAADRRFLVSGEVLRPEAAVLDAAFTRSLGTDAILSGVYEALARTIEPYASPSSHPGADQLALATAGRLAVLGDTVSSRRGEPVGDEVLLEIARLSGLSHAPAMHAGRTAFAFPGWFLAHELASVTGASKVSCLSALLPVIDRRARLGARAWGSARRRGTASGAVLSAIGLPPGDESALGVLAARWSLPAPSAEVDVDALTARILSAWGPPSPHLARVGRDELLAVLSEATGTGGASPRTPAPPAQS
ncbi:iron-containing alcohol dehydrogenase [Rathayibacter tanaceti]|uniref:Iron-containing alcohol dehydrogenase n=1 Tax=Rathayibacter tanaceti TaxID=1671680 RepID=A0AAE6V5Q4_9MICO|nr:iron-containing alcohol dehydrogenase [Rathayibacter tanaceti]QHC55085.1 iron-containing alcohol dehydrogenase [Rathayibacter tanaceti]